jgi:hypothetical protein
MKHLNVTTVLLVALAGFVGYTLYTRMRTSPTVNTPQLSGGQTSGADIAVSVAGAVQGIANAIGIIAKTSPQTNTPISAGV